VAMEISFQAPLQGSLERRKGYATRYSAFK
jgi:hypothetical protein